MVFLLGVMGKDSAVVFLLKSTKTFGKRKFKKMKNVNEKHDHPGKWMNVCIRPCKFFQEAFVELNSFGFISKKEGPSQNAFEVC